MSPTLRAALWMTGTIAAFSTMAIAGRELSSDLDTFEIMLYRSVVGFLIVCLLATAFQDWAAITRQALGLHVLRNMAHFTGQNLWFFAVTVIPLAQVFALEFTSPIWVLVLSPFLLGEKVTSTRILAAFMGFVGILLIVRPGAQAIDLGAMAAASSALFFALSIIMTKYLTRTQSITNILFWLTLMQLVMGLICAGYDGRIAAPSASTAPWLVLIGIAGLAAHYCLTSALSLAPATLVVPMDFIRLPVIALIGALVYGEALDLWVLIGALIIFTGNYINLSRR